MLTAARCWPQGWLVVRTMSQDLIGCWNQRKFESAYSSRGCREWFAIGGEKDRFCRLFFIVLWSYGRKICLNMCHGNSENSYGCSYLLRICFIYGKWVYRGVESLCKLLTANKVPFDLPNQQASANQNTVHLKTCFIWKLSWEWLLWTGYVYASGGSLRKLDRQLWNIRRKISHRCSSTGCPDVVCVNILIFTWIKWDVSSKLPWTKMVQKSKYNKIKAKILLTERLLLLPGRLKRHFVEFCNRRYYPLKKN